MWIWAAPVWRPWCKAQRHQDKANRGGGRLKACTGHPRENVEAATRKDAGLIPRTSDAKGERPNQDGVARFRSSGVRYSASAEWEAEGLWGGRNQREELCWDVQPPGWVGRKVVGENQWSVGKSRAWREGQRTRSEPWMGSQRLSSPIPPWQTKERRVSFVEKNVRWIEEIPSIRCSWNLEPVIQSEVSQKEEYKYCMLMNIYGF